MKRLRLWLNYLGWGVALIFFVYSLQQLLTKENWGNILQQINPVYFLVAFMLLFIGLLCRSASGYVSHRVLGFQLTFGESYRFWFVSQLAKYVPGGIWQFATRSNLYHGAGMPLALASALSVWEMIAVLLSGIAIMLVTSSSMSENRALWYLGSGLLLALLLLSQTRSFWRLFVKMKTGMIMLEIMETLKMRRLYVNIALLLLAFLGWIFINLGYHFLILALTPDKTFNLSESFFVYSLAWMIGFLVIIAPAGLGPREAVIVTYYLPLLGEPLAILIALLARLWWTLAEALHIIISLVLTAIQRKNTNSA